MNRERIAPAEYLRREGLAPPGTWGPVSRWWKDAQDNAARERVLDAAWTWWTATGPSVKTLRRDALGERRPGWKTAFFRRVERWLDDETGQWDGRRFAHRGQAYRWSVVDGAWEPTLSEVGRTLPDIKTVPHGVAARCYPPISCDCPRCWIANGEYRKLARFAGRPRKEQG